MTIGEEELDIHTKEFKYEATPGTMKELIEFGWKCPRCCFLRSVENIVNGNEIKSKTVILVLMHMVVIMGKESSDTLGKPFSEQKSVQGLWEISSMSTVLLISVVRRILHKC